MALTNKQAAFVEHYLQSFNATQAAIEAGYSEKTAYNSGWENLRKREIADVIEKRLDATAMTSNEVLARLAEAARNGDMQALKLLAQAHGLLNENKHDHSGEVVIRHVYDDD